MNDRQTAAILVGIAVVWFLLWYRKRDEEERAHLFGAGESGTAPTKGEKATKVEQSMGGTGSQLDKLLAFANAHGLKVTSTRGGTHNTGSLHYMGRAIDVSARGVTDQIVENLRKLAEAAGLHLIDERVRPPRQRVWGGPHLHVSVPTVVDGRTKY